MRRTPTIVVGEPTLHCWCAVCQLPSRIRVPLHVGSLGAEPASLLEICPGCGGGHDQPSVTAIPAPRPERSTRRPLVALAHRIHRWACQRRGQSALACAHGECPWPGLYRNQHEMPGDEGTWRYVFCTKRHQRAWATGHGILLTTDGSDAA